MTELRNFQLAYSLINCPLISPACVFRGYQRESPEIIESQGVFKLTDCPGDAALPVSHRIAKRSICIHGQNLFHTAAMGPSGIIVESKPPYL